LKDKKMVAETGRTTPGFSRKENVEQAKDSRGVIPKSGLLEYSTNRQIKTYLWSIVGGNGNPGLSII